MAYCKNCGQMIDDKAVICPKCGVQQQTIVASDDTGSFGWGLLGFCLPIVGLIFRDRDPAGQRLPQGERAGPSAVGGPRR